MPWDDETMARNTGRTVEETKARREEDEEERARFPTTIQPGGLPIPTCPYPERSLQAKLWRQGVIAQRVIIQEEGGNIDD